MNDATLGGPDLRSTRTAVTIATTPEFHPDKWR
jgi:hypothetical protein